jgi:VWFA-related protein
LAAVLALAPGPGTALRAQQAFPTAVELVAVDVTVVDRERRPVTDLRPEDLEVKVGGKPRRLVSAQLVRHAAEAVAPAVGAETPAVGPAPAVFSTNREAPPGRLFVLVPDLGSLSVGGAHAVAEAAVRFLSHLTPRDHVALVSIPTGPSIDFTTDHARVKDALRGLMGTPALRTGGFSHISLAEAFARFSPMGDRRVWCAAWEREVLRQLVSGTGPESCPDDPVLDSEARVVYESARSTAAVSTGALLRLLDALARIEGPKTVVLMSQGLVTGTSGGDPGGNRRLAEVADAAAAARASVYTIFADRRFLEAMDAEEAAMPQTLGLDQQLLADGLEAIAGYTGGPLLKILTTADFAFAQVASETAATWLLSFEPEAGDRDGRPHDIGVRVRRPRLEVRARPRFVVKPSSGAPVGAEARARQALDALLPEADVPLSVTAFALVGELGEVRLLVAAEAGLDAASAATAAVGYRLEDERGEVVAGAIETGRLDPVRAAGGDTLYFVASVATRPATYRLKVAVATPSGRAGSVERPVTAQLTTAGPLRLSDLVVGEPGRRSSGPVLCVDGRLLGRTAHALVEIRRSPDGPEPSVQFELAAAGEVAPRQVTGATLRRATAPDRLLAEATLDLGPLEVGRYELRAVVLLPDGGEAGRVARPIELFSLAPALPPE